MEAIVSRRSKYEELVPEIVSLRQSGATLRTISNTLHIPIESIRNLMHRKGIFSQLPIKSQELINYSGVSPLWFAEFRGFFWGEGCIYMRANRIKNNSGNLNKRKKITPVIEITQRVDNRAIIEDVQAHLGGILHTRAASGNRGANISWQTVGWTRVHSLVPYLLDAQMPSVKQQQLHIMKEACEARQQMSHDLTQDEYAVILGYYHRLRELKLLKS
jgi:hypothetical protein